MIKFQTAARVGLSLFVTLIFLFHAADVMTFAPISSLERQSYDFRLKTTMPGDVDPRVVIVDIDEKSLTQEGRWPWSRARLATLVDTLTNHYAVSVIGFDVMFPEPENNDDLTILESLANKDLKHDKQFIQRFEQLKPQLNRDQKFASAIKEAPVVLGFFFSDATKKGVLPSPIRLTNADLDLRKTAIYHATGHVGNIAALQDNAMGGGFVDKPVIDSDGVIRSVRMLIDYQGELYPSLSLAIIKLITGEEAVTLDVKNGSGNQLLIESMGIAGYKVPIDSQASMLVPYRGGVGSFPYISAMDVLNGTAKPEALENAIVLVGSSAAGLLDLRSTPVSGIYPGVEVHANAIAGVLDNAIKQQPDFVRGIDVVSVLLVGILFLIIPFKFSVIGLLLFALGTVASLTAANAYAWLHGFVLPYATPVLLTFVLLLLHVSYGYFLEQKNKKRLATSFGQYIPPELVEEMSKKEEQFTLEGESREMTVLFSDIRSFTSISEKLTPKELSQMLNEYLSSMTGIIHRTHGTIDKYIGDAVMAFWGAPLRDENHAARAMQAAWEMLQEMPAISEKFKQKGWPPIKIGVGLSTGAMNVGNMGSEFRMAYTVLGDNVNLGSRLESLTKKYGVNLIVSEATKKAAPEFYYRLLDRVTVVGKKEAVNIYEPVAPKSMLSDAQKLELKKYHEALVRYFERDWKSALDIIQSLKKQYHDKLIYDIYSQRITDLLAHPPAGDWSGVFTHQSK